MADNYKIKVQVEIVKCTDDVTDAPHRDGVGVFEYILSTAQAHSIDECEQILLQTNHAALRDVFAHHLSAASQQYALGISGSLADCEVKPYQVEGEIGRVTFNLYRIKPSAGIDESIAKSLFPELHAKEWYRTVGFKELALVHGTVEGSYRKTGDLINRVRHQEGVTPARTLRENTEDEGQEVMARMEQQATTILQEHGFTPDGTPTPAVTDQTQRPLATLPGEQVEVAVQSRAPEPEWVAEMRNNPVPYEDPAQSTHVSLDDVGVKRQKASRKKTSEAGQEPKSVHNTIAHIAHAGMSYVISGHGVANVLRLVLAFLLHTCPPLLLGQKAPRLAQFKQPRRKGE